MNIQAQTDNWLEVKAESEKVLPDAVVKYIEECRGKPHHESYLISILHRVQGVYGYLSDEHMNAVAQLLQVPATRMMGVATFYHFFRLRPKGKYVISVCLGTACYVKGAVEIAARFKKELGIDFGQTSSDGMFSLEVSRCVGTCGLAPVVMIDEEVHGKLKPDQVPALLDKYRDKAQAESD